MKKIICKTLSFLLFFIIVMLFVNKLYASNIYISDSNGNTISSVKVRDTFYITYINSGTTAYNISKWEVSDNDIVSYEEVEKTDSRLLKTCVHSNKLKVVAKKSGKVKFKITVYVNGNGMYNEIEVEISNSDSNILKKTTDISNQERIDSKINNAYNDTPQVIMNYTTLEDKVTFIQSCVKHQKFEYIQRYCDEWFDDINRFYINHNSDYILYEKCEIGIEYFRNYKSKKSNLTEYQNEISKKLNDMSNDVINPLDWDPKVDQMTDDENKSLMKIVGDALGVIRVFGTIFAVIILTIIGIKYIFASVSEKANYKASMVPYIVGCILFISVINIVGVIFQIAETIK